MQNHDFVSRGGIKLHEALEHFKVDVEGKTALDVGASTGGFTDCLLQHNATKVYALDTAYGELAWKLRNDPKVVVMERTNILFLDEFPERVDIITIDSGWTKLELVLPKVKKFLKPDGMIIALLKPHYEQPQKTIKGVIPAELVDQVVKETINNITGLGFKVENQIESPILGSRGKGNKEFLILIRRI